MADGTVANHLVNWLSPLKERITVVTGERGAFVADTLHGDLTFHENGLIATEWDRVASFRGVTEGDSIRFAIAKPEPLRIHSTSISVTPCSGCPARRHHARRPSDRARRGRLHPLGARG